MPPRLTTAGAPRRLLAVVAHPDDESYATYGTVALHRHDPAFRLVVLHATDGDAGQIASGVVLSPDGLGAVRGAGARAHLRTGVREQSVERDRARVEVELHALPGREPSGAGGS